MITEVASWCESEEVESVDVGDLNSGDVPDGLPEVFGTVAGDDEGSESGLVSPVPELALSGSQCLGGNDSFHIVVSAKSSQQLNGLLSLLDAANLVLQNQGNLRNILDSVTTGEHKSGHGGGGERRGQSVSPLLEIDFPVPSPPGLEWVGHTTLSGLVTEGTLSGSVSSGSADSGNSGHGTSGTP